MCSCQGLQQLAYQAGRVEAESNNLIDGQAAFCKSKVLQNRAGAASAAASAAAIASITGLHSLTATSLISVYCTARTTASTLSTQFASDTDAT